MRFILLLIVVIFLGSNAICQLSIPMEVAFVKKRSDITFQDGKINTQNFFYSYYDSSMIQLFPRGSEDDRLGLGESGHYLVKSDTHTVRANINTKGDTTGYVIRKHQEAKNIRLYFYIEGRDTIFESKEILTDFGKTFQFYVKRNSVENLFYLEAEYKYDNEGRVIEYVVMNSTGSVLSHQKMEYKGEKILVFEKSESSFKPYAKVKRMSNGYWKVRFQDSDGYMITDSIDPESVADKQFEFYNKKGELLRASYTTLVKVVEPGKLPR